MKTTKLVFLLVLYLGVCSFSTAFTQQTEITQFLAESPIPEGLRNAMKEAVAQHPDATVWSGQHEGILFAVVSEPLPKDKRFHLTAIQKAELRAKYELLASKAILDTFRAVRLDDLTALKAALRKTQGNLELTGRSQGVLWKSKALATCGAAYAYADASQLSTTLKTDKNLALIRTAYREEVHAGMKNHMAAKKWPEAEQAWEHLHHRQLLSQDLYLDATRCYVEQNQTPKAKSVLNEAAATYQAIGDDQFFETLGDLFLEIQDEPSAMKMFEQAFERLR